MTQRFTLIGMLWVLLLIPTILRAQEPFVIGVAPHTSARVILQMYSPLRLHLEKVLRRTVDIVTAPDFTIFARRGLEQSYDIAVTTGHQARLFQTDADYLPLLTYSADFRAIVLVADPGPVRGAQDLKKRKILGLSPSSLVTLWGLHWLDRHRLGRDNVIYVSASDSVAKMVLSGEAWAGFTSLANFQRLTPAIKDHLRVLEQSSPMAGRVYLLNRRHKGQFGRISEALWGFAETAEARRYFAENSLGGYRKLHPLELKDMDPYAQEVRVELRRGEK